MLGGKQETNYYGNMFNYKWIPTFWTSIFTNTTHVCLSPSNEGKITCALTHTLRSYILSKSSIDVVQTMKDYP